MYKVFYFFLKILFIIIPCIQAMQEQRQWSLFDLSIITVARNFDQIQKKLPKNSTIFMSIPQELHDLLSNCQSMLHSLEFLEQEDILELPWVHTDYDLKLFLYMASPEKKKIITQVLVPLLIDYSEQGNLEGIKRLLREGVPVDSQDHSYRGLKKLKRNPALFHAVMHNHYEIVEELLKNGANPLYEDFLGISLMDKAHEKNNEKLLFLLEKYKEHYTNSYRGNKKIKIH